MWLDTNTTQRLSLGLSVTCVKMKSCDVTSVSVSSPGSGLGSEDGARSNKWEAGLAPGPPHCISVSDAGNSWVVGGRHQWSQWARRDRGAPVSHGDHVTCDTRRGWGRASWGCGVTHTTQSRQGLIKFKMKETLSAAKLTASCSLWDLDETTFEFIGLIQISQLLFRYNWSDHHVHQRQLRRWQCLDEDNGH